MKMYSYALKMCLCKLSLVVLTHNSYCVANCYSNLKLTAVEEIGLLGNVQTNNLSNFDTQNDTFMLFDLYVCFGVLPSKSRHCMHVA